MVSLALDHAGQLEGVLGDAFDVDHAGDVRAAVADEDAHAGLHADHVLLGRVLLVDGGCRASRPGRSSPWRRGRGLGDRVGDVLGLAERAHHVDALAAESSGAYSCSSQKPVTVEATPRAPAAAALARRLEAGTEHDHVVAVGVQRSGFVFPGDQQVLGRRILFDVQGRERMKLTPMPGAW